MANPQKENGYTAISNEILEHIYKLPLNGTQCRILLLLWRFTYGFNRKEHYLSLGFMSKAINANRQQIKREIDILIKNNIIIIANEADFNNPRMIMFNKDYDIWTMDSKLIRVQSAKKDTVSENDYLQSANPNTPTVSELEYQERKNIKKNIKQGNCKFIKPEIEQVKAYCLERINDVDYIKWYDFYEAKGWMMGKNKMRDWKAAVRTWEKEKPKPKKEPVKLKRVIEDLL